MLYERLEMFRKLQCHKISKMKKSKDFDILEPNRSRMYWAKNATSMQKVAPNIKKVGAKLYEKSNFFPKFGSLNRHLNWQYFIYK